MPGFVTAQGNAESVETHLVRGKVRPREKQRADVPAVIGLRTM